MKWFQSLVQRRDNTPEQVNLESNARTEEQQDPAPPVTDEGPGRVAESPHQPQQKRNDLKALRQALEKNDLSMVQAGLDRGLDCNAPLDPKDPYGDTPLTIAAEYGSVEVADLLLRTGARVDVAARHGSLPIHKAIQSPRLEMINLLVRNGAGVDSHTEKNRLTSLMQAAEYHRSRAAEVLIELGADINARTEDAGETPLMYAAHSGDLAILRILLDTGADVTARLCDGRTALDISYMSMQVEAYNLLKGLQTKT